MIKKFKIDFPAFTGFTKRDVFMYLPDSYDNKKRYPVLYCFDGQNIFKDKDASFKMGWHIDKYLKKNGIDLIVVGVRCHENKHGERTLEYSPFSLNYAKKTYQGYGDDTLKWFINVLKKKIDEEYKTLPDREHTYILGSSMGGIMATYALLKYNNVFSRACSLSPAYFLYEDAVANYDIKKRINKDSYLYTDYGTKDLSVKKALPIFNDVNNMLIKKGINVTSRIVYNGVHNERNWEKQLVFAINVLMYK